MSRFILFVSVLLLVACGGQSVAPPQVSDGNAAHPLEGKVAGLERTLVARYHHVNEFKDGEGQLKKEVNYRGVSYRPRQSEFMGYEGWDALEIPWSDSYNADWLHLTLNRDATVVVVWESGASWLNGWQKGQTSLTENNRTKEFTSYTKNFSKGEVVLGGPGKDKGRYRVLIAEKDGTASQEPPLPAKIDERPEANATCPSWLHNAYRATGPGGQEYKSWHPQIDPVYWCYFGHEHGSDPSLVGYKAKLNYTATQNSSQAEQHQGFKGFAIRDEEQGLGWYINIHATTSDIARACVQFHTVVVAVTDLSTGELLAELSYKGDFGGLVANRKNKNGEIPFISHHQCPEQKPADAGTRPVKRIRVANESSIENNDYERWFGGITRELGMDFKGDFGIEIDIRNPGTSCNTFACTGDHVNNSQGDRRTIRLKQIQIKHDPFKDADGDGVFYTNPYGTAPASEGDEGAIRQFIKPGLEITSPDAFFATQDAWRARYTDEHRVPGLELESSLSFN